MTTYQFGRHLWTVAVCWPKQVTQSSNSQSSVLTATVAEPEHWAGGVLSVWARLQRSELLRLTTHRCSSGPRIIVKKHILILKEKRFLLHMKKNWTYNICTYNANDSMWNWCSRQAFTMLHIPVSESGLDIVTIVTQMVTTSSADPVMIKLLKICLLKLGRQR